MGNQNFKTISATGGAGEWPLRLALKSSQCSARSASARISEWQGYQGFFFLAKTGNLRRTRKNLKNGQNFTPEWHCEYEF
jgi:hypothetical protein